MAAPYTIRHAVDGRGRTPYATFKNSLTGDCFDQLEVLEELLKANGPRCSPKLSKPLKGSNLWELRKTCRGGAVRIYYWRSGQREFTFANGEVKVETEPSATVLAQAERLYAAYQAN